MNEILTNPELMATVSVVITIITQVLKQSSLPVTRTNALVVVLVLAVIVVLIPAYLNGSLTSDNAESLVASILLVGGAAVGVYEAIKNLWVKVAAKIQR